MFREDMREFKNEIRRESEWDKCDDKKHKIQKDIEELNKSLEKEKEEK